MEHLIHKILYNLLRIEYDYKATHTYKLKILWTTTDHSSYIIFLSLADFHIPCTDVDECKDKTACQCPECSCKNTWGSYECSCSGDLLYIKDHDTCISQFIHDLAFIALHFDSSALFFVHLFIFPIMFLVQVRGLLRLGLHGLPFGSFFLD